jgi:hypothetical protein
MSFNTEQTAALLDEEIERALDRLTQARRDIERDIAELEAEQRKRAKRRREQRR